MTLPNQVLLNQINLSPNRAKMVENNGMPTAEWQKWSNNVQVCVNNLSFIIGSADSPPIHPEQGTYAQGNIIFNNGATAGGKAGWICVVGGSPGTWKAWGVIDT